MCPVRGCVTKHRKPIHAKTMHTIVEVCRLGA